MTKIPLHIAEKLLLLQQGATIAASSAKHVIIEELVAENIVQKNGRVQKKLSLANTNSLTTYLQNKFGITDLQHYIEILKQEDLTRSDFTEVSSNSKLKHIRTFKGFLINCYEPIQAKINGSETVINPTAGTFQFIYDFENFVIPQNITIVGIENPENFRHIEKQKYLFENIQPLFVSRYPQNQSKDLLKWLQIIPNKYLHFGDFDFAGIGIYLNEYKKYLGNKASFFIPENIEQLIENYGNKELYDIQKINFDKQTIIEDNLLKLILLIHKYKKGLEQEIFIKQLNHK
ncbi:hypothetical protein AGMMS50239_05600 [Bacteroidia bacterium]|nr:hypothetical protein AGMMS50239_05600 [Bacteroidia bacterium]